MIAYLVVALACGALALTALSHLTLYRWALRVSPALARHRFAWAAAVVALFLWPLARLLVRASGGPMPLRAFAQFGSTWHLFVVLAMAPYGLAWLALAGGRRAARLLARRRDDAGAAPLAPRDAAPPSTSAPRRAEPPSASAPRRAEPLPGPSPPGPSPPQPVPPPTPAPSRPAPPSPGEATSPPARPVGALSRRRFVEAAGGAGALAASAGVMGWGMRVSRFDWRVDEVQVRLPRLPRALDGFTIAQISDLHVGPLWRERELRQGLALVAGLRPDLVVVTGDIIDYDPSYVPLAARLLGSLSPREGVAFVPGNHDHYAGLRSVVEGLSSAGLDALVNRGKIIAPNDGGGFALLGVDDLTGGRRGLGPDLERARAHLPAGLATVLLAHQPDFFYRTLRAGGIDLQLSGHTHGGQINPGFVPARLVYEFVAGRYERQSSVLYVNRGFGTVGPPMRAGARPELTKLVLLAG
ncbi:MAG TPA: metallophosphoesterase [Polyangiaceae bacterium]|nr:metallophosphoesterase [Polyangiaceae bacterium]